MPQTDTYQATLAELDMLTRRIKDGKTPDDLRRLLNQMNDLMSRLPDTNRKLVSARYNYLRGVLYIKGAVAGGGWIASGGESLYYAVDLLEFAEDGFKSLIAQHPITSLLEFRQECVYEAMVAITTLSAWGRSLPENLPDTGCLPRKTQHVIARHLSHGYPLRSHFA